MEPISTIYTPGEAAKILGVTTQSLRRYSVDYGKVFDDVPSHAKQRVFSDVIVERLKAAQVLQQRGVVSSIKSGLVRVRDGNIEPGEVNVAATTPFETATLERLERLEQMLRQLHTENGVLRDQIAAGQETRQLEALTGAPEASRRAEEAERMNQYLLGELERRRLEGEEQVKQRPWWRRWGRP